MPTPHTAVHYRTCHLCEAMCGLRVEVAAGRITSIRGDADDVFSRGHICPKAAALAGLHDDPERLRHPVRRTAGGWERIDWEEALTLAAEPLFRLQQGFGRDAIGLYAGNPVAHNLGALAFGPLLLRAMGTHSRFSATSVDQLPHMLASYLMFGHQLLLPVPDIDRTDYFLILGANPAVSNGSLMSAPGVRGRLRAIRRRGGRVVVVDPRRTETARLADAHIFIRPGTDAALIAAMVHTIYADQLLRPNHATALADGVGELRRLVAPFSPERVAAYTGVAAETIRAIAGEFAAAPSAVAYGRVGTSTQRFGGLCQWLINALNILTGNLDRAGGAMFTRPAVDPLSAPAWLGLGRGHFGRWRSRVRGLPEFSGELPVATLAEEILTPGPGRIRGMVTVAGNPVLSTPSGRRLDEALASLDHMVAIDFYVNETTRHAHVILPPTSPLERGHYDLALHLLAVRNTANYSEPVFEPGAGALHDWEILVELATRLEGLRSGRRRRNRLLAAALRRLGPERLVDVGLRLGPYGARRRGRGGGLSLAALRRAPHGIDLGPLLPCLPGRLPGRRPRIQLAPAPLAADLGRLAREMSASAPPADTLLLIGRRHLRSNNSWMHNLPKLIAGKPMCTLLIHPDDAEARGLSGGDIAEVSSRAGRITVPVEVTGDIMPGVVSLPHGFGHDRPGTGQTTAAAHPGASVNDVTDAELVDALCGTAALSGVPVRIAKRAVLAPHANEEETLAD